MNTDENDKGTDEKETEVYDNEATYNTPTIRPTSSSTTAKVGASVEVPSSNLDTDAAKDGNEIVSINKVSNK